MKIRLVDDWKRIHTYGTARVAYVMAGVGALGPWVASAWVMIPQDLRDSLPHTARQAMAWVLFAIFLFSIRHVTMDPKPKASDDGHA